MSLGVRSDGRTWKYWVEGVGFAFRDCHVGWRMAASPTHHTHGAGPWEWSGLYELAAGDYDWQFSKQNGVYGAPDTSMRTVVLRSGLMSDVLTNMHSAAEALLQLGSCTLLDGGGVLEPDDRCFLMRFNQT